jgi:hypothetical protein
MRCSIQSSSYDPNSEVGEVRGAETIKEKINYFRQAIPDLTYTVEDQVYLKATRS